MAQRFDTTPSTLHNLEEVIGAANLELVQNTWSGKIGIALYNNTPGQILYIGTSRIDATTDSFPLPNGATVAFDESQLADISVIDDGTSIDIRWMSIRATKE